MSGKQENPRCTITKTENRMPLHITLELPGWLEDTLESRKMSQFLSTEAKMKFAIDIAAENVKRSTGGPFGAIVFDERTHMPLAAGVNRVVSQNASIAHAETLAVSLAQKKMGIYDLSGTSSAYSLYSSGQPCIMCFGVLWWSGITKLVCAARAEDIETITGFKEGPLPEKWADELANREALPGVEVIQDVLRDEACNVLREYASSDQPVYNAGSAGK